jgi:uncharacterized protein
VLNARPAGRGAGNPIRIQESFIHAYRGQRPVMRQGGHAPNGSRAGRTADPTASPTGRKFANLELAGITGDGVFSGYASVFGEVDLGKDRIERGAFLNSLVARGSPGVRMLYQHNPNMPIGAWNPPVPATRWST